MNTNYAQTFTQYGICYGILFLITGISKLCKCNRLFDINGNAAASYHGLLALNFAGICWLGLMPIVMHAPTSIQRAVSIKNTDSYSLVVLCILTTVVWLLASQAGRSINTKKHQANALPVGFFHFYFPVRILFLFGYELFFRGFLLFDGIRLLGTANAILVSTVSTVLLHVFTNKKEMLGCIPFGIVLSACCIYMQAVWPAMILHVALCLAYELPVAKQLSTIKKH